MYIYKGIFSTCGSELDPLVGAIKEGFQEQVTYLLKPRNVLGGEEGNHRPVKEGD